MSDSPMGHSTAKVTDIRRPVKLHRRPQFDRLMALRCYETARADAYLMPSNAQSAQESTRGRHKPLKPLVSPAGFEPATY